jgi:plasmid stabilization system protein ParE
MVFSLRVRKEAEADISEAYQYYESCRAGLGSDLMLCIEESFDRILKNPNQYKTVHKNVRRALVRRFPYGIYYIVIENTVSVIAVIHARRNPDHWQSRT